MLLLHELPALNHGWVRKAADIGLARDDAALLLKKVLVDGAVGCHAAYVANVGDGLRLGVRQEEPAKHLLAALSAGAGLALNDWPQG